MTTFMLVPGAWLGGWVWKRVLPILREKQHIVYTPSLTGLGERSHLANKHITLETHITDVVNVLEYEDLQDVVLVGHSYSGMVVTGVANQMSHRLSHLVYLDAIVPRPGQSLFDDWSEAGQKAVQEEADQGGGGWSWPLPEDIEELSSLSGFTDDDKKWLQRMSEPQPLQTFSQPLQIPATHTKEISRSYILCTADRSRFPDYVEHARTSSEWGFFEIDTGHWPMITTPKELADIFLEVAHAA